WFDDGNIILMAQNLAFKVYKGMLSQHSAVLRAMLETEVTEIVEECPAIHLDDSTADL
ncbi:hypothetical protein B0H10DRAFT_1713177, partial [Mycena sp. CBHHK59/15]